MNAAPTDVFALAEKRLNWIAQRQDVLAQNIANANTPGYAARDVRPFAEVLASQAGGGSPRPGTADRATVERTINGNAVVLDQQLEKVAETDTAHQLALNLYKKYTGLFKTAIGRG